MATASSISPEDLDYYATQQRAVLNTQAIGQRENNNAEVGANLTYSQKLQALQEKLTQEGNALPDKFAARGIQNSGILNYGSGNSNYTGGEGSGWTAYSGLPGGQLGANQQFKSDQTTATNDLTNQQENVDQGYTDKMADLNNTANNQVLTISTTEAAQNAAQAAADAVGAAG